MRSPKALSSGAAAQFPTAAATRRAVPAGGEAAGALRAAAAPPALARAPRPLRAGAQGRQAARSPQGPPAGPPPLSGGHRGGEGLGVPGELPAKTRWRFLLLSPIPGVSCRGVSVPPWPRCLAAPFAAAAGTPLKGLCGSEDVICNGFLLCLKVGGT